MDPGSRETLRELLESARGLGLVGPGPVDAQVEHALRWAERLPPTTEFLDLGSGAGLPGLVVTLAWERARATLLDSRHRSAAFLEVAVGRLQIADRVQVVCERAEVAARLPDLRGRFALVLARGFGPPAATAECGAGFLGVGGTLSVSEPPDVQVGRWPEDRLAELGLGAAQRVSSGETCFVMLRKVSALDDRWPRRDGRPHRRPLW